jgi:hypothetical protein
MVSVIAKKSGSQTIVEFKSLKFHDESYQLGDIVMISEHSDDTSFGTLVRIWKRKDSNDPMVRIRWFYKPSDVFPETYDFLSKYELFDSDHEQDISVMCLYGKAQVMNFEDYYALDEVDDDVFFTRARYFTNEKVIRPSFEEWRRSCMCQSIINPDHLYVGCDKCSRLYHPRCVGFEGKEEDPWVCFKCIIHT